jgi:hypothetical protein
VNESLPRSSSERRPTVSWPTQLRQILSATAVVLSLLFVGLELRQNTRAQRAQTRQELANASRELLLTIAANPSVARAYSAMYGAQGGFSDSTVSQLDSLQARYVMFANLRNIENVWLQYRAGIVGEEVLTTYAFSTSRLYQTTAFRQAWECGWSRVFDTDFVRAFEEANGLVPNPSC